jgi:hypothetical protein
LNEPLSKTKTTNDPVANVAKALVADPLIGSDFKRGLQAVDEAVDGTHREFRRSVTGQLENIIGHLGAALTQALLSDDRIMIGHLHEAYGCARILYRRAKRREAAAGKRKSHRKAS